MPEPTDTPVPRRILLDIDGTLLIDDVAFRRVAPDDAPAPIDTDLPPRLAARLIDAPWPGGGGGTFRAWYRPAAITALRRAHDAGTDLIWSTSWLAGDPAALDELADLISAGFVRRPTVAELPAAPNRYAIDTSSRLRMHAHWKIRAWRHHLATAETVLIDDDAYFTADPFAGAESLYRAGWIRPRYGLGLHPADLTALDQWVRQGLLPAIPRRP